MIYFFIYKKHFHEVQQLIEPKPPKPYAALDLSFMNDAKRFKNHKGHSQLYKYEFHFKK